VEKLSTDEIVEINRNWSNVLENYLNQIWKQLKPTTRDSEYLSHMHVLLVMRASRATIKKKIICRNFLGLTRKKGHKISWHANKIKFN